MRMAVTISLWNLGDAFQQQRRIYSGPKKIIDYNMKWNAKTDRRFYHRTIALNLYSWEPKLYGALCRRTSIHTVAKSYILDAEQFVIAAHIFNIRLIGFRMHVK